MPKVYVAIINQGWIKPELSNLITTMSHNKIPGMVTWHNRKPASHNRNIAVQEFLKTDCDYFLSIDHDVVPYKNPLELVREDKDIIGLPARVLQKGGLYWTVYNEDLLNPPYYKPVNIDDVNIDDLLNCDIVGSGCILIKRKVLEKIKSPFSREWTEDGLQKFGLDFAFCRRAKKEGFKIYSATKYRCEHYKENGLNDILGVVKRQYG